MSVFFMLKMPRPEIAILKKHSYERKQELFKTHTKRLQFIS